MSAGEGKQSFVMYGSFLDAAELLDDAAFRECVLKLRDFALYGEKVSSKNPLVEAILLMAKPNIDAAAARYQRCVENGSKGKEYGALGGRPRKNVASKTPKKPLNVDEEDDEKPNREDKNKIKDKLDTITTSGTPSASPSGSPFVTETGSVSGGTICLSFSPLERSMEGLLKQYAEMSDEEYECQYKERICKIADARAKGEELSNEKKVATTAALMCKAKEGRTYREAKDLVQQDITYRLLYLNRQKESKVDEIQQEDEPF